MIIEPSNSRPSLFSRIAAWDWVAALPKLRDLAIVVATAAYVTGYAIWGIYAYEYGLGTRSAVQMQYFVAGAPGLVVISLILVLFYWFPAVLSTLGRYLLRKLGSRLFSTLGIMALVLLCLGAIAYPHSNDSLDRIDALGFVLIIIQVIFAGFQGDTKQVRAMLLSLLPLFAFSLYFYALYVYPDIPQELGGGRPKCVVLGVGADSQNSSWQSLVLESQKQVLVTLNKWKNGSETERKLYAMQSRKVEQLYGRADAKNFSETGPLLLWSESDSNLLLSVTRYSADLTDRYLIPRSDSLIVRYVSEISGGVNGCPASESNDQAPNKRLRRTVAAAR
jgi:hypothetical protein